jgi:hypothetical protein
MTVMSRSTGRRGRYTRARRDDRPVRCRNCRTPIVWAAVVEPDGQLRRRSGGELVHVPLNAKTSALGKFEYVRGTIARPVVRELDEDERLAPSDADRFHRHYDVPVEGS